MRNWLVHVQPSIPRPRLCVLLVIEVLLDQGGQSAGQVGIVQLLSLPLGREVGSSLTPLSLSPHKQRGGGLSGRGPRPT